MIKMDFAWLTAVMNAPVSHGENSFVSNINTDTRTIKNNEVFLALKGPNFDGHKFVQQAYEKGAIAAIVDKHIECEIPQFIVPDTRLALGQIGAAVMKKVAPKTIAITGSVGKTTVKEMCAAILSKKGKVLATNGNFNNDIGVPLTLIRLSEDDEYAVIELGANHIGEIAYTANMTKPDVAAICNVAPAHIEGFGSITGVAQAKGEIFSGLKDGGCAVFNCDIAQDFRDMWDDNMFGKRMKRISTKNKLDIWAEQVCLNETAHANFLLCDGEQKVPVSLAIPGEHNVANALIAAALTSELGASLNEIAQALESMDEVKGRVNLIKVSDKLTVIDDTYNANVRSVKAAIDLLINVPGFKIFALGDMGELGEHAREYHQEVGEYAKQKGIDVLFTLGVLSRYSSDAFEIPDRHFSTRHHLLDAINQTLAEQDGPCTVIVKGSRSARMEILVEELITNGEQDVTNGESAC